MNQARKPQVPEQDITTILRANGHLVPACWDAADEIERLRDRVDHFKLQFNEAMVSQRNLHERLRELQAKTTTMQSIITRINL